MTVDLIMKDGAAILTIDNPPLNLLNAGVRAALDRGLDDAVAQGADRLIITGAGRTFVAGADAKEFGKPPIEPHLNDILLKLAQLPIATIAAINGAALGGGLEIALACRYRIAAPGIRLGLPEVTLGIVPGAGGTQRLPRLVGIKAALDMIVNGKVVSSEAARSLGLIDSISADPVAAALALESETLAEAQVPDLRATPPPDEDAAIAMRNHAKRRMPGQHAPGIAVDLVAASAKVSLAEGFSRERAAFLELRASAQAAALRHVFFAERAATGKGKHYPQPERDIATAIVVGGGNMGASIAYVLATSGIQVIVVERDAVAAARAEQNLRNLVNQGIARGQISTSESDFMGRFMAIVVGYDALPPVDLAIEAAFEDFEVKKSIFTDLETVLPPHTILATNTSYLDVNRLGECLTHPSRFIGLHFFSPAHVMKLLEIVRGDGTSTATIGAGFRLAERLRKIPVLSRVCEGFIGNRILTSYRRAANRLLAEGATPDDIDAAMRRFGMAMGPYETQDASGLDIAYANLRRKAKAGTQGFDHIPLVERLIEKHNRLGRKSGGGWYDYGPDGKSMVPPTVMDEIFLISKELNLSRRTIPHEEIVDNLVNSMAIEASNIINERICESSEDIDLVMIHGYGFPRWRGGLMYYKINIEDKAKFPAGDQK